MPDTIPVLLVDPDASRLAPEVESAEPRLRITPAHGLAEARAHLSGTSFDAIVAAADLPDGNPLRLFELGIVLPPVALRAETQEKANEAERAGARVAFAGVPNPRVIAAVASWMGGGAREAPPREASGDAGAAPEAGPLSSLLPPIRDAMARVVHEINNPLAVIAGNAQLARELLAAAPDDPMLPDALRDIEAAATDVAALMSEVTSVRRQVEAALQNGAA
jgi:signal transduction histidine kinase